MPYVLLNNRAFLINEDYEHTPPEELLPLIDPNTQEEVGQLTAATIRTIGLKVPACYKDLFEKRVFSSTLKEYEEIDIRVVLRLVVNNERFIHYVVGPVLVADLACREGGQYYAYKNDENGKPVLFGGSTGKELGLMLKSNISACKNRTLISLHDKYFEDALAKLKEMHLLNDVCIESELVSINKDPNTYVLKPGEDEDNHKLHCQWCLENGLNGMHHWNNDGNVSVDGSHTTHSHYKRTTKCDI